MDGKKSSAQWRFDHLFESALITTEVIAAVEELLSFTDDSMYKAKHKGAGTFH